MESRIYISQLVIPAALRWAVRFVCLLLLTACGNLYTGEEEYFDPSVDPTELAESVPVMVAFSDPYYNILTTGRGVGKIDPQDSCFIDKMNPVDKEGNLLEDEKPRFFIYAFRKNYPFYITRADDPKACLADGSCGLQAAYAENHKNDQINPQNKYMEGHGKWAEYSGNGSFVTWRFIDDKLYYPNGHDEQNIAYDFYAYYHDGAVCGEITRDETEISFPVKIDGSQDLMCGQATLTPEQLEAIDKMENEEEKQAIKQFYYSAYSGRRNVWPIFQMQHQLAYVKVNLKAGNVFGDPVRVHDIRLETHTQGTLVVASKNGKQGATFDGTGVERLPLRDVTNGKAILSGVPELNGYIENYGSNNAQNNNGEPVGEEEASNGCPTWEEREIYLQYNEDGSEPPAKVAGELLIPPGKYLVLHTWLSNQDTKWKWEYTTLPVKTEFEAGRTYNLNLTVYGPKLLSIEVKATPWKEGGDIDVDMEDNNVN